MEIKEAIRNQKDKIQNFLKSEFPDIQNLASDSANEIDLKKRIFFSIAKKAQETTSLATKDESVRALLAAADMRGLLETLIVAKLCEKDNRYVLALSISFFEREISFVTAMKNNIANSADRLEILDEKDNKIILDQIQKSETPHGLTINNLQFAGASGLYDLDAIEYGFGFSADYVRTKIIPVYKHEIGEITSRKNAFYKNLLASKFFIQSFPSVKSESNLKDAIDLFLKTEKLDDWKGKSRAVSLFEDYESVYSMTSNVLHVTSFSLFTKGALNDGERDFYLRMTYNYLREILAILDRNSR